MARERCTCLHSPSVARELKISSKRKTTTWTRKRVPKSPQQQVLLCKFCWRTSRHKIFTVQSGLKTAKNPKFDSAPSARMKTNLLVWFCGEVEDVVGALTPVVGGVAQVCQDLLVELRLLLVAEVEEGEKEDRQEEGWEVESGVQGEEVAHMDDMWMTVSGVRARLELEPMWVWWNVQGTGLRAQAQLCSATQAVKCAVALSSPSSFASVSLSFLSQFSTLSSRFSLLWYCNSSHSFLVAIFHTCLHCILTAF